VLLQDLSSFDVASARCHREEERQKILAIIESGFGSSEAFNSLVSSLFRQKILRDDPLANAIRQASKLRFSGEIQENPHDRLSELAPVILHC
jgi:hypothetical protein